MCMAAHEVKMKKAVFKNQRSYHRGGVGGASKKLSCLIVIESAKEITR